MKQILVFLMVLFVWSIPFSSYATHQDISLLYTNFLSQISDASEKEQAFQKIDLLGQKYLYSRNLTDTQKQSIRQLLQLNNDAQYASEYSNEFSFSSQKIREIKARKKLQESLITPQFSSSVQSILQQGKATFILTNSEREFFQDSKIKKVSYTQYFKILPDSVSSLKKLSGIILYENEEFRFITDYEFLDKIPYSELPSYFQYPPISSEFPVSLKNGVYQSYNFVNYKYFPDEYGIYLTQLAASQIDPKKSLIYRDENDRFNFVIDFTPVPLFGEEVISGVAHKKLFLQYIADDMKYESENIAEELKTLKNLARSLQSLSASKQDFIESSYHFVIDTMNYSQIIDLSDKKIFSALESYKQKQGVCTAYAKLFTYLLYFGYIGDVEMIKGHVIDAPDFPKIGHAWVRIEDSYYDPTFDDPIGTQETKTKDQYLYFQLPKDIFYANRYSYDTLPEWLRTANPTQISEHIYNNLSSLITKYSDEIEKYPVFAPVLFRKKYDISATEFLSPEIVAKNVGYKTVRNNSFTYEENGTTIKMRTFQYFVLTNDTMYTILNQIQYNFSNTKIFYWQNEDGSYEWRLAYNIVFM